ncbi:MAG: fibronectin type III domain-containing protein, partial [Actinomycetota bacterium]
ASLVLNPGRTRSVDVTIPVGTDPYGVAVDQGDDTVYVTNNFSDSVSVINGRTRTVVPGTIPVGSGPYGVAVDQGDDTVYVTNSDSASVSVINGRTGTVDDTIPVGTYPNAVAVDQGDDTVYVTNRDSSDVSVINGRTGLRTDDTITVGTYPWDVAVDESGTNAGLVFVTNYIGGTVSVIAPGVDPGVAPTTGPAGTAVTITLTIPNLASSFPLDSGTITGVTFGDELGTSLQQIGGATARTWSVAAPSGTAGATVDVVVTFNGGNTALAGTFTFPGAPTPPAVDPPGAPTNVAAVAGNAEASVSWTAPTYVGSFPITDYEVVSSPGSKSCLAKSPALSCTVTGLSNGTAYTFTARALTGAGWGATSSPSDAVTPQRPPQPSIVITGTRAEVRGKPGIVVTGTTTGFGMGAILRPWTRFPGQTSYTQGTARILVDVQGGFTWERRTGKTIYILIRSEDGTVESNRLALRTT